MEEKEIDTMDIDPDIKLTDLIDVDILQKMQNSFANMARMAALITDTEGEPLTEVTNFSELCLNYCRNTEIGRERCKRCDKLGAVMSMTQKKPVSYRCHANLIDFAAPIMLGDRLVGSFIGGQVLAEAPNEDIMRMTARSLGVDPDEFWEAAQKTQVIPQAAIDRATKFIYEFAATMSDMAFKSYQSIQLSNEAMQAAIQKQDFLANMSHEIRTPMNAVLGMTEMALREPMSIEARNYVNQIRAAGKNLLVIINDILDFSKIDSGKMTIVESGYETEELIDDLANVVNDRIGSKGINFIVDIPVDMPVELYGDYVRIHQVLLNLLNNAVKFTSRGAIILKMSFEPIDNGNVMLHADVIDTGHGIKEEDLGKLFNSFQQVDSKRNRNVEGTGLGLAICKQLVELMHGSISVKSEYDKGSTFSIDIPQKVQTWGEVPKNPVKPIDVYFYVSKTAFLEYMTRDLGQINCNIIDLSKQDISDIKAGSFIVMDRGMDADIIVDVADRFSDSTVILIVPYDSPNNIKGDNIKVIKTPLYSKKFLASLGLVNEYKREVESDDNIFSFIAPEAKVLIVDDNPVNLQIAKGLMDPLQMQVDTAGSAQECIKMIQAKEYNLIFMDHMMPEVDGVETTHIIRRMYSNYADVPIIALTANATGGAKEMFIAEGMNDFVAKPIETKKMVAKIREWLPAYLMVAVDSSQNIQENDSDTEDFLAAVMRIRDLDVGGALGLLGNGKLYFDFLKSYYHTIDDKIDKIQGAYTSGDIRTLTIEMHSLKSSSKQIGANYLSGLAEALEKAGNDNDMEAFDRDLSEAIDSFRLLQEKLAPVLEADKGENELETLDYEKVSAIADELTKALADFDFVSIDGVWERLGQYRFSDANESKLIEQIKASAEEFDEEACNELLCKWKALYWEHTGNVD